MANEQLIDTIVSPDADKQVSELTKLLNSLDIELIQNAKDANALNAALLANSGTFTQFNKNATAAALAQDKLTQSQNKTATTLSQLNKAKSAEEAQTVRTTAAIQRQDSAQAKAAANAQKALSPYAQLSKQLEDMRSKAKDLGVQFGVNSEQFKNAAKPVQELDTRIKTIDQTLGQSQRNVGNYGNAFKGLIAQFVPFGREAGDAVEVIKKATEASGEGEAAITGLSAGFIGFTTGAFAAAIGSVVYYLSLFKSSGEQASQVVEGLKGGFAQFGQNILRGFTNPGSKKTSVITAFNTASDTQEQVQALQNKEEITNINNASLQAQAEYFRALSTNRTTDISDRQKYLSKAQDIEKQVLENQKKNADLTIKTAIEVGFKQTTLTKDQQEKQKVILLASAANNNLQPAQNLALNGQQFTSAGFDLFKKGIEQRIAYTQSTNNQLVQLQADKDNQELRADKGLAQAQNALDKARIESAQNAAKVILDSATSSNRQRLAANANFIQQSIALIKNEEANQLEAAGLGAGRSGKDSRTEIKQREAIEQDTQNKITAVQLQGTKTRQDIRKNQLEAKLRADKADIDGAKQTAQLILETDKSSYSDRLKANADFITQSLALIEKEKVVALKLANLPSNPKKDDPTQIDTRRAILKEFQNQIDAITATGLKGTQKLVADAYKDIEQLVKRLDDSAIGDLQDNLNDQKQAIEKNNADQVAAKTDLYLRGKLTEKQYTKDIKVINDKANEDKIQAELDTEKRILAIQQALAFAGSFTGIPTGITPQSLQAQKNKVGGLQTSLTGAKTQTKIDGAKDKNDLEGAEAAASVIGDAQQLQEDASRLIQGEYASEIALLEKKSELIKSNADEEIAAVNSSIASEKTKQDRINIINAQTAIQQKQIADQEQKLKEKQAKYDRALAIASIIENTAVGATKATGTIFGISLVPIILALGAAELATVLATPLPTFAKGGYTPGGNVLWGEAGTEAAVTPKGDAYVSNGANVANFPRNTRIYSHAELMAMNAPKNMGFVGGEQIGWQEVVKAIDRQKQPRVKKQPIKININGDFDKYRRNYFR